MLAAGRRRGSALGGVFFVWTARNRLKSPESDEGIQEARIGQGIEIIGHFLGPAWVRLGGIWPDVFRRWRGRSRPAPFRPDGQSLSPGTEPLPSRLELPPQSLERIEFAPGNGMASDASDPQYLAPGAGRLPVLDRKADPAAAGGDRVRVLDLERLAHQVVDEVELGPLQHLERDRVDDHGRPVAGGDEIVVRAGFVDVERILEARAAAALDRNPQRRALFPLEDGVQPPGGAGADRDGLGDRSGFAHERLTLCRLRR